MINVWKAKIKVKKNLCGFLPTTIKLKDESRGNFYFNFGDIEVLEELSVVQNPFFIKDFRILLT